MSESPNIFLGFEARTVTSVQIPIFHMLVTGQTRLSGKTTLLKALSKRIIEKGFKVLILDSKSNFEDYSTFGHQVPVCLRKTTDSLPLLELLESIFDRKISRYYPTLTNLTENAKSYGDIIKNAEELKVDGDGFIKGACDTIIDLLKRLEEQTLKVESTTELKLPYDINRMTINQFDLPGQHLIANSVFTQALRNHPKLIIVLDEANKFLPQKRRSACTNAITLYVTQGGATENYLWLSTQFLATTSKDAMKAMAVKLLGRQDHTTEVGHALDLIPEDSKFLDKFDIMKLNLGHFVFVDSDSKVKTIYAVPEYANIDDCKKVAQGLLDPRNIRYSFDFPAEEVRDATKQLETLVPFIPEPESEPEKEPEPLDEIIVTIESETIEPPKTEEGLAQLNNTIDTLRNTIQDLQTKMNQLEKDVTRVITLKDFKVTIKYEEVFANTLEGKLYFLGMQGFLTKWHLKREIKEELTKIEVYPTDIELKKELEKLAKNNIIEIESRGEGPRTYYKFGNGVRFSRETPKEQEKQKEQEKVEVEKVEKVEEKVDE